MRDTLGGMATIHLPGGFWLDGMCCREASLRPLSGGEEAFFLEWGRGASLAERTTVLLAACLVQLGALRPVTPETVRSLTVGDREALLLHLRRLTLGDSLQCELRCQHPGCGEKMDLDLRAVDLLLPPYAAPRAFHETTVAENGAAYHVRFRLPTGADQEAAAALAHSDPHAAAELVLQRCVESVTRAANGSEPLSEWPPAVAEQLPATMAELDPQAELILNLTCPTCGHAFSVLFDTAAYFFQELDYQLHQLYREVHLLALHYHWSEAEIMGMATQKRRRYLKLLIDELSEARGR